MSGNGSKRLSVWGLLSALLFLVSTLTLAGFLGDLWWFLDIASGLRFQYVEVGLLACILFGIGRRIRLCLGGLAVAIVNGSLILPAYLGREAVGGVPEVRVLLANVRSENKEYGRLLELVRSSQPDLILLEELNSEWVDALGTLRKEYPQHVEAPEEDNFGIGFYTRFPVSHLAVRRFGEIQVASVVGDVETPGGAFHFIGTHPLPPVGQAYWHWRNNQLVQVASWAGKMKGPVVILGDLNTPPWSPSFRRFMETSRLRDSRKGFGLQSSWPTFLPPLGIPIDHCLVSSQFAVCDRRLGPSIGSDHAPVIVDLRFR